MLSTIYSPGGHPSRISARGGGRSQGSLNFWCRNIAWCRLSKMLRILNINSFILSCIKKITQKMSPATLCEPLVCAGISGTICGEKLIVPQLVINVTPSLNLEGSTEYWEEQKLDVTLGSCRVTSGQPVGQQWTGAVLVGGDCRQKGSVSHWRRKQLILYI